MGCLNSSASFGSFDYDEQYFLRVASSVFESGNREKINLKWLRPVIEWAAGRRPHAAPVNRDGAEGEEAKRAFSTFGQKGPLNARLATLAGIDGTYIWKRISRMSRKSHSAHSKLAQAPPLPLLSSGRRGGGAHTLSHAPRNWRIRGGEYNTLQTSRPASRKRRARLAAGYRDFGDESCSFGCIDTTGKSALSQRPDRGRVIE